MPEPIFTASAKSSPSFNPDMQGTINTFPSPIDFLKSPKGILTLPGAVPQKVNHSLTPSRQKPAAAVPKTPMTSSRRDQLERKLKHTPQSRTSM
jgi:hypothetical protein